MSRYLCYRELRRRHSFKELASSADLATEVTLLPFKRFPLDAAIVFADIMSPLPALGVEFEFAPGPVVANPIRDQAGVDALHDVDPGAIAPEVMTALQQTRAELEQFHFLYAIFSRDDRLEIHLHARVRRPPTEKSECVA